MKDEKENEKKQGGGRNRILGVGIIVLAVGVIISVLGMQFFEKRMQEMVNQDVIYQGISIDGEDVSGLTTIEAIALLDKKDDSALKEEILKITHKERSWDIPFSAIDVKYDVKKAVDKAWNIGREGEVKERYKIVKALRKEGKNLPFVITYDDEKLKNQLEAVGKELNIDAQDSEISRKNGGFVITQEKSGIEMDLERTMKEVLTLLKTQKGGKVEAVVAVTLPQYTKVENEKITDLLSSYSTNYSANATGRNENLRVGSQNVNGKIVAPGEEFSMNVELGPQTYANGYKDAGIYVNGKVEQGVGGGVCQVSSTLYNAAIFAELEITERLPHSMTVGYVPLGRDAAIAGTYKDLKFKNNTDAPIFIEMYAGGGKVVANIYGKETRSQGREVVFEKVYEGTVEKPVEKITEDPELPEGERKITSKGRTGCRITTYKKVFEDGELVSREWFSASSYRAAADEVTVGTKKMENDEIDTTQQIEMINTSDATISNATISDIDNSEM